MGQRVSIWWRRRIPFRVSNLQSNVIAATAERNKWYNRARDASGKHETAEADVALQKTLWNATLEDLDTRTAEVAKLHGQLRAKNAELSELNTKSRRLATELS